jgi:peroxiredoxin Q/BCP
MAQLRDDYDRFVKRRAVVLVVGPEKPEAFRDYWHEHRLPFVGLADPGHTVLKRYGQEVKLFKLGRMPAQIIIDRHGRVRFVHYGHAMTDIPPNDDLLAILDTLNAEAADGSM